MFFSFFLKKKKKGEGESDGPTICLVKKKPATFDFTNKGIQVSVLSVNSREK